MMDNRKIKELEAEITTLKHMLCNLSENTIQLAKFVERLTDIVNGLVEREQLKQTDCPWK